jgi:hypothetical protein
MIRLYKDGGDGMGIETDCKDEVSFRTEFSVALAELIDNGAYDSDWEFQLEHWLRCYMEICLSYRGYGNSVGTLMSCGNFNPGKNAVVVETNNHGVPILTDAGKRAAAIRPGSPSRLE